MSPSATADLKPQLPSGPAPDSKFTVKDGKHVHGMEDIDSLKAFSHGDIILPGTSYSSDAQPH